MLALDCESAFDPAHASEFLDALPARPAVVLIEPRSELVGARPLLLRTADLRRRLRLLLGPLDPSSKRVNLREYASGIRFRLTGSAFEQSLVQWQHARMLWPRAYRDRLRMRPPALVKLTLAHAYPRAYVTRRIGTIDVIGVPGTNRGSSGLYFGPFESRRSAIAFLDPLLDLFRMRRCQIKIHRDPAFPGCIYSELKMCLAPCFAGCTDDEYAAEVGRVADFLVSRGEFSSQKIMSERESASADLDFERASALHKRLEKMDALRHGLPELARDVTKLDAVILQRAAEQSAVAVFVVRAGRTADPFLLHFSEIASQPRSVEQILRSILEPPVSVQTAPEGGSSTESDLPVKSAAPEPADLRFGLGSDLGPVEREDHLALLARWFYARPREGESFFYDHRSGWPYRRILRACARVLAPRNPDPKR